MTEYAIRPGEGCWAIYRGGFVVAYGFKTRAQAEAWVAAVEAKGGGNA